MFFHKRWFPLATENNLFLLNIGRTNNYQEISFQYLHTPTHTLIKKQLMEDSLSLHHQLDWLIDWIIHSYVPLLAYIHTVRPPDHSCHCVAIPASSKRHLLSNYSHSVSPESSFSVGEHHQSEGQNDTAILVLVLAKIEMLFWFISLTWYSTLVQQQKPKKNLKIPIPDPISWKVRGVVPIKKHVKQNLWEENRLSSILGIKNFKVVPNNNNNNTS